VGARREGQVLPASAAHTLAGWPLRFDRNIMHTLHLQERAPIYSIDMHPDGTRFATGAYEVSIRLGFRFGPANQSTE
jgi:hypothetical protein